MPKLHDGRSAFSIACAVFCAAAALWILRASGETHAEVKPPRAAAPLTLSDIHLRDPFLLPMPERKRYKDKFDMFASFKAKGVCRGTQILIADEPAGPYRFHSDGPVTPREWECLDGTLYFDKKDKPWMVFCHEWLQVGDGEICAMPLRQ